jgi:hypothetical protein
MPDWKHSQYFFKHADFLQWHPFACCFSAFLSPLWWIPIGPASEFMIDKLGILLDTLVAELKFPMTWRSLPLFNPEIPPCAPVVLVLFAEVLILGRKALDERSKVAYTAADRSLSCCTLLWQEVQLQCPGMQYYPEAKHSQ